jgi:hypothetical protein
MNFENSITLGFKNFEPNFDPLYFWKPLIESSLGVNVTITPQDKSPDILIQSVYAQNALHKLHNDIRSKKNSFLLDTKNDRCLKIWFTAENLRPPISGFSLYISFDTDNFFNTNYYFPGAISCLDWFSQNHISSQSHIRTGFKIPPDLTIVKRVSTTSKRKKFACAFVGNPEPIRMRAIQALNRIAPVDLFGKASGHVVQSKSEVALDYQFMICFENEVYPGYITEKPIESWALGCIPIWRGQDPNRILNPKALVNAGNLSISELTNTIAKIYASRSNVDSISSEPIFLKKPSIEPLMQSIRNIALKSQHLKDKLR